MPSNHFFKEHLINEDIQNGDWKDLILGLFDMSVNKALDVITNHYNIDEDVSPNLFFTYFTWKWITKHTPKPSVTNKKEVKAEES